MSERLNVRRMQMPEEKDEHTFDPEKDISPDMWRAIESEWKKREGGGFLAALPLHAVPMQILRPGSPHLTDGDWKNIDDWIAKFRQRVDNQSLFPLLYQVKILDPARVTMTAEELLASSRRTERERGNIGGFAKALADLRVLGSTEITVTEQEWGLMLGFLDELQSRLSQTDRQPFFLSYVTMAADMRILKPEKRLVPPERWPQLRSYLQKESDVSVFLRCAAAMKIVAADDIRISKEQGLELIMPEKDVAEKAPAMPASSNI